MIIVKYIYEFLWSCCGQCRGVGSVQFQIVPCSSLQFFSRSIGPFQCLVTANYRLLICCTCHFQSSSLFFLCLQALQCLFSILTQWGKDGNLFKLTCSVVLWGWRNTTNITGVCEECSQCMDHIGFAYGHVCSPGLHCSGSRLLWRGTVQSWPWVSCTSWI